MDTRTDIVTLDRIALAHARDAAARFRAAKQLMSRALRASDRRLRRSLVSEARTAFAGALESRECARWARGLAALRMIVDMCYRDAKAEITRARRMGSDGRAVGRLYAHKALCEAMRHHRMSQALSIVAVGPAQA